MELYLLNTSHGLIPLYDEDYDERKKLRIGLTYKAKIVVPRDITLHRKYFALLRCAWSLMNEGQRLFFKNNEDVFRSSIQVSAGYCKPYYHTKKKEWFEESISISFSSMSGETFEELYSNVFDVVLQLLGETITEDQFRLHLLNFM